MDQCNNMECNKCGSPLDPNLPQPLCPTCGFQILDTSMQIIHQEPPKEGFPLKIAKVKAIIMQKVYDFNFWRVTKTQNLALARNLLERDSRLLRSIPLLYSSENEAILTAQMQETAQKIRSRSGELETAVRDITSLFEQKDFVSTRLKCKQLLPKIRKQGLIKWTDPLQELRKKAHANIIILRDLQKCPVPIVPESPPDSILTQYMILASLDKKMSNLIHKDTASLVESVKTTYTTELGNRKISIPTYGFITKLIANLKTMPTKVKDIFTNTRFMWYTNGGLKWQNLPKAWNTLQKAQKLADDPQKMIFFDYKAEFDQIITETRGKIANLTEEAEKYLTDTLALMNQFKFDEPTVQLQAFIKTLQTYKMVVLADQMQGQIALIELSKTLLAEVQEIEAINEKKDSLTAQKSLFELKTRIEKEIGPDKVINSLVVKITMLEDAINRVRTQGESDLLAEIETTWNTLQDQLNFEESERMIYQQRTFAEQQEFRGVINRIDQILGDLNQNKTIYIEYQHLQELVNQEAYKTVKEGLVEIYKKFDKKGVMYFPKLQETCHDLDAEIDKKIGATDQNLKKDFEKAKKDLEDQLDFFHAAENLNRIELRAIAAGLSAYSPLIKEITERLVFNQKIQTEIVAHEKKLQEGHISEAQTAIDQLVKDVSKHAKAYIPKLVERLTQVKDVLEESIENEDKTMQDRITQFNSCFDQNFEVPLLTQYIQEMIKRVDLTGLTKYTSKIEGCAEKLKLNQQLQSEMQELQKLFGEGDIKVADKNCQNLLAKVKKSNDKAPGFYSSVLQTSLDLLAAQIEAALKDGEDSLKADYAKLINTATTTINFNDVLLLTKNMQIRAQRLDLLDLKQEITNFEIRVQKNMDVIVNFNTLLRRYEQMEDFIPTINAIKNLQEVSEKDPILFDHVKTTIRDLMTRVDRESSEREQQIQRNLQEVINTELNKFNFPAALTSLQKLYQTALSLGINTFNPLFQQNIAISQTHQSFQTRLADALVIKNVGKIIESRDRLRILNTHIDQHQGPVLQVFKDHALSAQAQVESEIEETITKIKDDVQNRLLRLIEDKKGEMAFYILEEYIPRAKYLQADDLVKEMNDLIKVCLLQFDPNSKEAKKRKNKIIEEMTLIDAGKLSTASVVAARPLERQEADTTVFAKVDYGKIETTPHFATTAELREYKRKTALTKKIRIISPPPIEENLNNTVRSSTTRSRLQAYTRQVNAPQRRVNLTQCPSCGAKDQIVNSQYCYFCGRHL